MSHKELEAWVGEFRRMMKGEFKGLHDRLDRLENARAGLRYPNSYGQRRDTVPNRETHDDYYEDLRRRDTTRASSSYQANPWKPTFLKKEEKVQLFSHPKPKTEVPNPRMQGMAWCSIQPLENLDEEEDSVQEELVAASSIPTLEDVPNEECAVQGELLVALNSTTPLEDTEEGEHAVQSELLVEMSSTPPLEDTDEEDHAVLELLGASSALTVQIEEVVCFDDKIKEEEETFATNLDFDSPPTLNKDINQSILVTSGDHYEDLEHFDFIGVEQILSMTCSKRIISSYLRSYGVRIQLAFLALRWGKNRSRAFKYSKYLFRWSGRYQYWCYKDLMDLRTNPFQEGGNDVNMAGPSMEWGSTSKNGDPLQSPQPWPNLIQARPRGRPRVGLDVACKWPGRGLQVAWTWPRGGPMRPKGGPSWSRDDPKSPSA